MKFSEHMLKQTNQLSKEFTEDDACRHQLKRLVYGNKKQRQARRVEKMARKIVSEI